MKTIITTEGDWKFILMGNPKIVDVDPTLLPHQIHELSQLFMLMKLLKTGRFAMVSQMKITSFCYLKTPVCQFLRHVMENLVYLLNITLLINSVLLDLPNTKY